MVAKTGFDKKGGQRIKTVAVLLYGNAWWRGLHEKRKAIGT